MGYSELRVRKYSKKKINAEKMRSPWTQLPGLQVDKTDILFIEDGA